MKRFKVGEHVFIKNPNISKGDRYFIIYNGSILTVTSLKKNHYVFCFQRSGSDSIEEGMFWSFKEAKKNLIRYNKRNWCKVFLQFMKEQEVLNG